MKRVSLTFSWDFEDSTTDADAIEAAIEIVSQDKNWPEDGDVKIENIPEC